MKDSGLLERLRNATRSTSDAVPPVDAPSAHEVGFRNVAKKVKDYTGSFPANNPGFGKQRDSSNDGIAATLLAPTWPQPVVPGGILNSPLSSPPPNGAPRFGAGGDNGAQLSANSPPKDSMIWRLASHHLVGGTFSLMLLCAGTTAVLAAQGHGAIALGFAGATTFLFVVSGLIALFTVRPQRGGEVESDYRRHGGA